MLDYRFDKHELAELRAAHRAARDVREAYRINAVILLGALIITPPTPVTPPPASEQAN